MFIIFPYFSSSHEFFAAVLPPKGGDHGAAQFGRIRVPVRVGHRRHLQINGGIFGVTQPEIRHEIHEFVEAFLMAGMMLECLLGYGCV